MLRPVSRWSRFTQKKKDAGSRTIRHNRARKRHRWKLSPRRGRRRAKRLRLQFRFQLVELEAELPRPIANERAETLALVEPLLVDPPDAEKFGARRGTAVD